MVNCDHKDCGFRAFTMSELKRHKEQRHPSGVSTAGISTAWSEGNYAPSVWSIGGLGEGADRGWEVNPTPPEPDTYSGGGGGFGGGGASGGWDDNGFSGGSNGDN